jgi:F-type H+-transporting ATPase subunit b
MIDIDWTLFALLVNFLLLVFLLNMVLFRPIRKAIADRQARIRESEAAAGQLESQTQGLSDEIKEKLAAARKEGAGQREALKQEGAQAEASLLEEIKKQVDLEWAQVEKKIQADMAKARESLKKQAKTFAQLLASKVLGREVS